MNMHFIYFYSKSPPLKCPMTDISPDQW